mgnify:CR=1 FL=1
MKLGGEGVALHGEGRVPGQIVLPGDGPGALKQLLEAAGRKPAQHQQDPGAAAQVDVQPRYVGQLAPAQDPAVFHLHIPQPQPPDLVAHQFFQPQQAGHHKCLHIAPRSVVRHMIFHRIAGGVSFPAGACPASGQTPPAKGRSAPPARRWRPRPACWLRAPGWAAACAC